MKLQAACQSGGRTTLRFYGGNRTGDALECPFRIPTVGC